MKLAHKLNLALVVAIGLILSIRGKERIDREIELFETEARRDHRAMGRALGSVVAEVWDDEGADRALELLARVDVRESVVRIRWVWLDGEDRIHAPAAPPDVRAAALEGDEVFWVDPAEEGRLVSYLPVDVPGERAGALELAESTAVQDAYLRQSVIRVVTNTVLLIGISSLLVGGIGAWFVGRPVQVLIEHARRVGAGDFSGRVGIRQRDELGELATEIDSMTDQLATARERIAQETAAKVEAVEQLRHADRLMSVGQLASGIAHELGTPLNVVSVRARMIQTGEVHGEEVVDNARIIKEQCDRMTEIIRQLLDFARPRPPSRVRVDLAALARQTLVLLEPMARKHSVHLELIAAGEVRAEVDPGQIQQVVLNLAVNGIQAMPQGGTLRIRLDRDQAAPPGGTPAPYARILVEDEGGGIAPEHLGKIFDPFFTTKDVGAGTGLGLSVSYGIVRDHGGFLAVAGSPGAGACFTVHLPEVVA